MARFIVPKEWKVWHCEHLQEIDSPWVDPEDKKYAECLGFPCMILQRCVPVVWVATEIKVVADQALILINPVPEPPEVVEEPKISELTI